MKRFLSRFIFSSINAAIWFLLLSLMLFLFNGEKIEYDDGSMRAMMLFILLTWSMLWKLLSLFLFSSLPFDRYFYFLIPFSFLLSFILDLLILYLRKCLIPAIRGKNKKLLVPSFSKVFSKVKRG